MEGFSAVRAFRTDSLMAQAPKLNETTVICTSRGAAVRLWSHDPGTYLPENCRLGEGWTEERHVVPSRHRDLKDSNGGSQTP